MSSRGFDMYDHRQIFSRMRSSETDQAISRVGLLGRKKAAYGRRARMAGALI